MTTVNYAWTLPTVGASTNTWGTLLNAVLTDIDAKMFARTGGAITGNVSVTGYITPNSNQALQTGSLFKHAVTGMTMQGTAGSSFDLSLYSAAGNALLVNQTGTNDVNFASGNVGVGVTPSAWRSGDKVLDMGATTSLVNAQGFNTRLYNNVYVTAGGISIYKTTDFASYYDQGSGVHRWLVAPSGTAGNAITFTQSMTLDGTGLAVAGALGVSGNVLVKSAAGLGYGTGAGGTVTQATSKSTAVTLNKPTGQITMNNSAIGANLTASFTLNNSLLTANDLLVVNATIAGGNYNAWVTYIGATYAVIKIENTSASTLSEAVVINFTVIKGATA